MEIAERIYKILTHKKHRCGPLDEQRKDCLLKNISKRINNNEPVKIFQFWGGAKNPNLNRLDVDLCEEKTLEHLFQIHDEIKQIYTKGLSFVICTGDARVEYANNIPHENTVTYYESFLKIINNKKFDGIFSLVPVSSLYSKNISFWKTLGEIYSEIKQNISNLPKINLERLFRDANKNTFQTENQEVRESGIKYISVMISEEKSDLYKEYQDYIRSFFIKFSSDYRIFYEKYLPNRNDLFLTSKCSIYLYTIKKGCISQPWQSVWSDNGPIGQELLKKSLQIL